MNKKYKQGAVFCEHWLAAVMMPVVMPVIVCSVVALSLATFLGQEAWSQDQAGQVSLGDAQKDQPEEPEGISLNFHNVEIGSFLQAMSEALQVALVWDEKKVRGTITVISPRPFEKLTATEIFESVLSLRGYAIVQHPTAPLLQVLPAREAPKAASKVSGMRFGPAKESLPFHHTEIIPLRYADGNSIVSLLKTLVPNSASVLLYKPANVLMLTESKVNLQRMKDVIEQLDAPSGKSNFEVFKLKYAEAQKLTPLLRTLGTTMLESRGVKVSNKGSGSISRTIQIQSDIRTNSLLVVASKEVIAGLREIINEIDAPPTPSQRGLKVFRLEHSNAEELVKIFKAVDLKSLTKSTVKKGQSNKLSITSDKATNSLVVFGPNEAVATVAGMLKELDVRPPQVFVELLVMEMSLEKSLDLGVSWQALNPSNGGVQGGGFPSSAPLTPAAAAAASGGALIGVIGNTINYSGQSYTSFSGFVRALQKDQDVNIVANPQVLTINNKEAEINVSSVIPVSTRTVTNTNNQSTTEFEFRDIGVILKITPQITSGDRVRLIIKQEFSSISSDSSSSSTAVTTLKRSINTEVVVDDKSTMAIGGLIHNQTVNIINRVPFLSRIWIIGSLFRNRQSTTRKTNLLVFIRPTIINSLKDGIINSRRVEERYDRTKGAFKDLDKELRKDFKILDEKQINGDANDDANGSSNNSSNSDFNSDFNNDSNNDSSDFNNDGNNNDDNTLPEGDILPDELLSFDYSLLPIPQPNLPPNELQELKALRYERFQELQYAKAQKRRRKF